MKFIKRIHSFEERPFTFFVEKYNESTAQSLLSDVIGKAREINGVISDAYKEEWTNKPSTGVRVVFGHWLVNAARHFGATIILCEEPILSVVSNVHHRQIFEIFLQVRYYVSLKQDVKEKIVDKISAWGCVDYLEKLDVLKDDNNIKKAFEEISKKLTQYDKNLVDEIIRERKNRLYNWFGISYSQLAQKLSREGENLRSAYQIISADVHGAWNLALDVSSPNPGVLDFRGYPDDTTLYIRAAETLDQVTSLYMNLWNEIAKSVGAKGVYYSDKS